MSEQKTESSFWLPSLDGWRAIAIGLVLMSHAWAARNPLTVPDRFQLMFQQGDFGVRIFLVVSGLLITLLLLREYNKHGDVSLPNFYIRRVIRIFPVYYLFLLFLATLQIASCYHDALSTWIGSVTFTRNFVGQGRSATGHLWSLAVEEQFYLVWPVVLVALGFCRRWQVGLGALTLVAVAAVLIRFTEPDASGFIGTRILGERSALRYMDSLAIGCIGAFLFEYTSIKKVFCPRRSWFFYGALVLLVVSPVLEPADTVAKSCFIALQSILVLVSILYSIFATDSLMFRFLNSRPLVFIGTISYSLYIWHMVFLAHYIGDGISGTILHDGRFWLIPSIAVACLSYFCFERPLLKLKKRLQRPRTRTATRSQEHDVAIHEATNSTRLRQLAAD